MKTMKLALFLVMAFVLIGTNDASAKRREQQTSIFAYTCDRFTGIQNQPVSLQLEKNTDNDQLHFPRLSPGLYKH